jgi:hypothetical protein
MLVAIPALFLNLKEVIELSSIGTLFAFVLVCGGVLVLENSTSQPARPKFKTPYINGRYFIPLLYITTIFVFRAEIWGSFLSLKPRLAETGQIETSWEMFRDKIPMLCFIIVATALTLLSFVKRLSLIPVLGLLTCFYLMTQLGVTNWARFLIWLVAGLAIYFAYGRHRSKLNDAAPGRC